MPPSTGGVLARLAVSRAILAGVDVRPILARAGLADLGTRSDQQRIGTANQVALLDRIADAVGDVMLGFHLANAFDLREIGLLYYVMASAPTLRSALEWGERYSVIANEGVAPTVRVATDVCIRFRYVGVSRHLDRHQIEFWTVSLVRMLRQFTGRNLSPTRVGLLHARCAASGELETFLGHAIEFEARQDELRFSAMPIDAPLCAADPYLHTMLLGYCEDALGHRPRPIELLRTRVENAIAPLLPHGRAAIGEVARQLGMSPRTLSRRLAAEGFSFAGVLTAMREDLARYHLTHTRMPVSRIAWLLGYREASAFTHAFRRWTGRTPTEIRACREDDPAKVRPDDFCRLPSG